MARLNIHKRVPNIFFIFYLLIIGAIFFVTGSYLFKKYKSIEENKLKELKNLASIKSQELQTYLSEEQYKLQTLINSEFFNNRIVELFLKKASGEQIYQFLNQVKSIKNLEDIIFIEPGGKIIFSVSLNQTGLDTITLKSQSLLDQQNYFFDLYKGTKAGIIFAYQFPVYQKTKEFEKLLGYIRFEYDALSSFLPRVEHLEPYSTREIFLVKREENNLIYLSYLKNINVKPFNLMETIDDKSCWVNLFDGVDYCTYKGLDYAGNSVFSVVQRVQNTNLFIVTKQNTAEVYKEFRSESIVIVITLVFALITISLFFWFIINKIIEKRTKREKELEEEKGALESEHELVMTHINDVVIMLDSEWKIVKVNKASEKLYGYKPEELIGKTIDIICLAEEKQELLNRFNIIDTMDGYVYEALHKRKDGSLIDVEVNAKSFSVGNVRFYLGSIRDISERKKLINKLQKKLGNEQLLSEIAADMIHVGFQNFDEQLNKILHRISQHIKVDRIRVFRKDNSADFYHCVNEWCNFGITPFIERLRFIQIAQEFPFLFRIISEGKIFKFNDINELPQEANLEKQEMLKQDIKSALWKPLYFNGELKGFLSFQTVTYYKKWTNEDEVLINIFSEILLIALNRIDFEKELYESEQKFKKMVENSIDVTLVTTKDFKNKYLSHASLNVLGYLPEERINKNPLELIHPDDHEVIKQTLESIVNIGDKKTIRVRAKHKLGHYIWIEATITNLLEDPLIGGYLINYHDITSQVEAYQKLQESEERYRLLAEETGDVLYTLNYSNMKYEYISPVISKLTGYTADEINEIGFSQIVEKIYLILNPSKSKEEIIQDRLYGKTGEYLADYLIITKSGELKWVRDHSFPRYDANGKIIGSIGVLTDVSEIKKHEEEILIREKYLETLVDIQKSLIFLNDLKQFYNYMLEKLGKLIGVSRCYVFENSTSEDGRLLMSQIAEWCNEGILPQIDNPTLQNLPYDELGYDLVGDFINYSFWSKKTRELPEPVKSILEAQQIVSILLIPIFIQDEFYGYIGFDDCEKEREWSQVEIDILKSAATSIALAIESLRQKQNIIRARDEAMEANRLRSGFLSIISHEIRTPLNSILGYTEVLKDLYQDTPSSEVQNYFDAISRGGKRLLNTINQLIEISRLEAGEFKVVKQPIDINKHIIEVVNLLKFNLEQKNLNLMLDLADEQIFIEADDFCVHGILENLISNAIKYSNRGTISIQVKEESDSVLLTIKDEGIGISEEYLKHLFKPFSQEDVSYKRKFEGTGLGLAITKRYLDLIGGDIKIESKKGIGTTCYVKLKKAKID